MILSRWARGALGYTQHRQVPGWNADVQYAGLQMTLLRQTQAMAVTSMGLVAPHQALHR